MLEIDTSKDIWPDNLKPIGEGFQKEEFSFWWARHRLRFNHLDQRIVEQWIYRHWDYSPFMFLSFDKLSWQIAKWAPSTIIERAYVPDDPLDAEWDYKVFTEHGTPTGRPFIKTGTWDYPIVLLETPEGVCGLFGEKPDVRYLLIEGHLRRRCLNAMAVKGLAAPIHDVFLLRLEETT